MVDFGVLNALFFGYASSIFVPVIAGRTPVRTRAVRQFGVSTDRTDVRGLVLFAGPHGDSVRQRLVVLQLGDSQLLFVTTAHALIWTTFVVITVFVFVTASILAIFANCFWSENEREEVH